jgi:hypothetical protein
MTSTVEKTSTLIDLLAPLNLPVEAKLWLATIWEVFQGLDDWRDGDELPKEEIEKVIYQVLVLAPQNPFFQANANQLLPVLSTSVLKWCGANVIEDERIQDQLHKAYVWRACFYDLLLETVVICNGFNFAQKASPYILSMYGETFDEYAKEFING